MLLFCLFNGDELQIDYQRRIGRQQLRVDFNLPETKVRWNYQPHLRAWIHLQYGLFDGKDHFALSYGELYRRVVAIARFDFLTIQI